MVFPLLEETSLTSPSSSDEESEEETSDESVLTLEVRACESTLSVELSSSESEVSSEPSDSEEGVSASLSSLLWSDSLDVDNDDVGSVEEVYDAVSVKWHSIEGAMAYLV